MGNVPVAAPAQAAVPHAVPVDAPPAAVPVAPASAPSVGTTAPPAATPFTPAPPAPHIGPGGVSTEHRMAYGAAALFVAIMLVVGSLGLSLFADRSREDLTDEFRDRLRDSASIAALQIDAAAHQRVTALALTAEDPGPVLNTSDYQNLVAILQRIKSANREFLFVYTMVRGTTTGTTIIIIDAEEKIEDRSLPGDVYDAGDYPELFRGFEEASADTVIDCDRFGACMSGYAPIRNETGASIGLLGIDASAKTIRTHLGQVDRNFAVSLGIVAILSGAVGALLLLNVHRQVVSDRARAAAQALLHESYRDIIALSKHLSLQADRVKAGNFDALDIDVHSKIPEIQELVKSFRFLAASSRMQAPIAYDEAPKRPPGT